ncbi:MAG: hypothetical protein JO053_12860 [Acidobacteria bacterium]|nr:hypothetical protein [Acidobacteriota bacterium]
MLANVKSTPKSWLAFDLNILRRVSFNSVVIPISEQPSLGAYLKRWDVRVQANHHLRSSWSRAFAQIANNAQTLTDDEVNAVLDDAYVPGYKLQNEALRTWFNEIDCWWFDNVRRNIDRLPSQMAQAIASSLVMDVGDYALTFDDQTRELREPLSNAFRRFWSIRPDPYDNRQNNTVANKPADEFIAETPGDLMFLRLPQAHSQTVNGYLGRTAWREEWLRGGSGFWESVERSMAGKLGSPTGTKSQYLNLLEDLLRRATHIKNWAIAHVESGFIQTQDIVETIGRIRRVDTVYTKDFSELTGAKGVIITA